MLQQAHKETKRDHSHLARSATRWIGSPQSIVAHTIFFIVCFIAASIHIFSFDRMLLILTTLVSLEAIYLAIFIQMTVNQTTASIAEVEEDIDEMQEDVEEIQKDVDELQEDVEEMSEEDKAAEQNRALEEIRKKLAQLGTDLETFAKTNNVERVARELPRIETAVSEISKATAKKKETKKVPTPRKKGKKH